MSPAVSVQRDRETDRQQSAPSHLCLQKLNMALGKISPFPLREKHLRGQDSGNQKPQRTDFSNFIMEISHPAPKPNRALRPSSCVKRPTWETKLHVLKSSQNTVIDDSRFLRPGVVATVTDTAPHTTVFSTAALGAAHRPR